MTSLLPNSRRPDVTFYPDGRIDITARIAKHLNMAAGDVIDIAEHQGEYLLYVRLKAAQTVGRHEACVYPTKRGKHHANNFRTYSRRLTDAIFRASSVPGGIAAGKHPLRLPAGLTVSLPDIGLAIPLITRNPLKNFRPFHRL